MEQNERQNERDEALDTTAEGLSEGMLKRLEGRENDSSWMISIDVGSALRKCLPKDAADLIHVTDGPCRGGVRGYRELTVKYGDGSAPYEIVGYIDVKRKVVGKTAAPFGGQKNSYGYKEVKFSYAFGAKDLDEAISKAKLRSKNEKAREEAALESYAKVYEWIKGQGYASDGYSAMSFLEQAAKSGYRLHNSGKLDEIFGK